MKKTNFGNAGTLPARMLIIGLIVGAFIGALLALLDTRGLEIDGL